MTEGQGHTFARAKVKLAKYITKGEYKGYYASNSSKLNFFKALFS